jgi:hypothetical protein
MEQLTTRQLADILGTAEWRVRRLFEDGTLPEPARFAGKRILCGPLVLNVVDALRDRGWLSAKAQRLSGDVEPGIAGVLTNLADHHDEDEHVARPEMKCERRSNARSRERQTFDFRSSSRSFTKTPRRQKDGR